jgi:hypothetical protein
MDAITTPAGMTEEANHNNELYQIFAKLLTNPLFMG